jgi:hypothetical protein
MVTGLAVAERQFRLIDMDDLDREAIALNAWEVVQYAYV